MHVAPLETDNSRKFSGHTFHIPVMGTGYTADTPLKVAKYGIHSTISLVDDVLLEQLRKYYCEKEGEPYVEITNKNEDARADRITAYLNLLDRLINRDVQNLKKAPFEPGSEITKYFEMLPNSDLRTLYSEMLNEQDESKRRQIQTQLRGYVRTGRIDVNIMTKIDKTNFLRGEERPKEFSDAMSALRGFANSTVRAAMVLSAGMNPKLYGYLSQFEDFYADNTGAVKKEIILKVSDFRSGLVQSKFIARSGLWVSELRIEASLNCGGHAFATEGHLLGPILEKYKNDREEIISAVKPIYERALNARGRGGDNIILPQQRVTVQGGIGTFAEDKFLLDFYEMDGTGWATPFMVVPDVVNVDKQHLEKLKAATSADVYLSNSSPLKVPFWMLRNSDSELLRLEKIENGTPGSSCKKGYLAGNTEFTNRTICIASRAYQKKKMKQLETSELPEKQLLTTRQLILDRACICHDLGGGVKRKLGIDPNTTPTVCCGPNIINFAQETTLFEMIDHIYDRGSLLENVERPHMFITELSLYYDELKRRIKSLDDGLSLQMVGNLEKFRNNIELGIEYYKTLAKELPNEDQEDFLNKLKEQRDNFDKLIPVSTLLADKNNLSNNQICG